MKSIKIKDKFVEYKLPQGSKTIKHWREDDRPREKLMQFGAESLSDSELLAIIIGSGTVGISAIDVAKNLLTKFHDLNNISQCSATELMHIKGIGEAKAIALSAAFELSKRIRINPFENNIIFNKPDTVAKYYINKLQNEKVEYFYVAMLTSRKQLFREKLISKGILSESLVHPREVFRSVIAEAADSIILVHNHPSGECEPSDEDIALTEAIYQAGRILQIPVLDHIIVAGDSYYSFAQNGLVFY